MHFLGAKKLPPLILNYDRSAKEPDENSGKKPIEQCESSCIQDVVPAKMILNPMQQPIRILYLNDIQRFRALLYAQFVARYVRRSITTISPFLI
jgi:hypothetical protein